MISIIVSTYRKSYFDALLQSIRKTIGEIAFEVIPIENHGQYSISQAYNLGAEQAQYNLLCFVHEDVIFESSDWGKVLLRAFQTDADLGALGVAGGRKTQLPTGWGSGVRDWDSMYIHHGVDHLIHLKGDTTKINVLDGVLIVTPKTVWQEFRFDETVGGFHFYDIDYSLRVAQKYHLKLTEQLLICHFSQGNFGSQWIKSCLNYHRTHRALLTDLLVGRKETSQIRKFYYGGGQPGIRQASWWRKLQYVCALGIDFQTIKTAIRFLLKHG
ncbi:MAG: glycosyltransferase family protein [Candidatus Symbiothrix sp.]|jgi:hypothetical protein|nr:glycosyltransferase family protein [Candidatus Symbiothrix sp.]